MNGMTRAQKLLLVSLLTIPIIASGCSSPSPETPSESPSAEPSSNKSELNEEGTQTLKESGPVKHFIPEDEHLTAFIDDAQESQHVVALKVTKPVLRVYLYCRGDGDLEIEIKNLGEFRLPCEAASGVPSLNEFGMKGISETAIQINTVGETRWSASVTEVTEEQAQREEYIEE